MEKPKIDELKAAVYWIATNYQQNYYEISSDWNKYNADEHVYLKNYIGYALYGPPEYPDVCNDQKDEEKNGAYFYKEKGAIELIDSIFHKVIEHGTQLTEEEEVLCSAIYCCIYDDSSLSQYDVSQLHETIQIIPIFKVQKCIQKKVEKKLVTECQVWFIDTEARVYNGWKDYLTHNNLPTCTMVAPKNGIYQADLKEVWSDKTSAVWVEAHRINTTRKITNAVDIASTLVNLGCIGIGVAAIFNPISAPVALAGAVGGAVSGAWGGGRAVTELVDRGKHDQSISIVNKHAIPAWLGVAGSTLGLAASSGSALLSRAIRTGTSIGTSARVAHDAIMIGNLFVNSVGVGYNSVAMVQKYRETGEVSAKDVFFLTAHVLFICNSAVKMRLASDIIKSDQNQILKDYEESLRSNRHRKEFRRLVRNTGSNVVDEVHRNEQIIRSLTKISNKDEFFATMVQNRKTFASTGTQLSFAEGQVQINGVTLINPSAFASMSKDGMLELINQVTTGNSKPSVTPTSNNAPSRTNLISSNALKSGISTVRNFCVQKAVALPSDVTTTTTNYKGIVSDLQDVAENSKIIKLLLETGMCIVKKITTTGEYSEEDALADATNFIWSVVKINMIQYLPGIDVFNIQYQHYIHEFVQATYDYVKTNSGEWVKAFRKYWDSVSSKSERGDENQAEKTKKDSNVQKENKEIRYNDIILLDPSEVMGLPIEVSTMLVEEALSMTGSKMSDDESLPKEMAKMCEDELNDFFAKHPVNLDFKLASLVNDFKGILIDLKNYDKNDIIFYKLLIISINITQRVTKNSVLKKDVLVDVMKCLWIFVNINFTQILPDTCMFNDEYESSVINIIIAFYRYQLAESKKWSSAFEKYREKYGKK
ncbi:uncharacterized protein LOC106637191 isoform X2 [Copidosoma floridanum]|uniref:uncharacterized protein LOC106637191 isoform X2 n=1 Tax=Copidosoma floridanum TaxID=29053 RepID=UPI000C6F5F67|nr:uncharacterized protein LOC106637191 isoform X2 [Copidosoma floridanum]